ncbi:hypothetical protein PF010_g24198 [Phytophthora fragariae]|nr:hypothetical protein PF009_g20290 [Phytophthora fragariae]KAE9075711.1 hypothetical protein PF010_g24198 [Phytophthora fragariae]KAE9080483.1 hypothetical protein PF007_g23040 [Phytophthora fragariae]KAE9281203.1 hypothetical protein PF001_g23882 [Phytophthora fragariae]KAE9305947.1 hypothetical protein PF008_g21589 [Phytophthora fragariae]
MLLRERDAARSARDQIRQERDVLQQNLDAGRQKLTAVAAAMGTPPAVDGGTSGPAAVLHSLRSTPVCPSAQDLPADPQDRASSGPDAATSPPSSKRPRSLPASLESSPAPPAKREAAPLSPDGDDDHASNSSAGGSGSSPVDLTQDDGHLADDDRGASDASDADPDAGSGSQGSVGSGGKEDSDAKSSSDEEEDEHTAEVANDLL